MNEKQLHDLVVKYAPGLSNLKRTTHDRFCSYDAENDKYVVEYKCRRKYYNDGTQLEFPKFDKNTNIEGKKYLYSVYDGKNKIHVWDVSALCEADYDFQWTVKKCPATTDFDRLEYIDKKVGILKWEDAKWSIKVGPVGGSKPAGNPNGLSDEEVAKRRQALEDHIYKTSGL